VAEPTIAANQKTGMVKQSLKESIDKNDELKALLKEERRKVEELRSSVSRVHQLREMEPMEVEVTPPPQSKTGNSAPPTRAVEEELKRFPAMRSLIKKQRKVISDRERDLPPPEIIEDISERRISSKKKKGLKGPSFEDMEVFSSVPMEIEAATTTDTLEDRVAAKVVARLENLAKQHMGGEEDHHFL